LNEGEPDRSVTFERKNLRTTEYSGNKKVIPAIRMHISQPVGGDRDRRYGKVKKQRKSYESRLRISGGKISKGGEDKTSKSGGIEGGVHP